MNSTRRFVIYWKNRSSHVFFHTSKNMREYGFSLTRFLSYKDKIYNYVLTWENTRQWMQCQYQSHWLSEKCPTTEFNLIRIFPYSEAKKILYSEPFETVIGNTQVLKNFQTYSYLNCGYQREVKNDKVHSSSYF